MTTERMATMALGLLLILSFRSTMATPVDHHLLEKYKRPITVPYPDDNPTTAEKQELGKTLFFDPRLSKAKNISCLSCHHPGMGWEMGIAKAIGTTGIEKPMDRKAQTLYNLAWSDSFFWDGRAEHLENQILTALFAGKAMANTPEELVARIKANEGYRHLFQKAFGKVEITKERIAMAIATYVRSLISPVAPFDRWVAGDESAISEKAKKGFMVFNGKARCNLCHSGWNFSDNAFHDTGLSSNDVGRGKQFPKVMAMQFAFKTPGLRDIAKRAPFFHDGSLASLKDVIEFYDHGGQVKRASLSPDMKKLSLSRSEKENLYEFLRSLSSDNSHVSIPDMVF